jgi:predicted metalloprotease with PDZ domain
MTQTLRIVVLTLVVLLGSSSISLTQPRQSSSPVNIAFTVGMSRPHTHLLEVDVRIKRDGNAVAPAEENLRMPVWTPGSYLIREFERQVQDFVARDAAGQPLKWEKTSKDTWKVYTNGARDWRASYKVYANDMSIRTSELNSSHAHWNNANILMYLDGYLQNAATVHVLAPEAWKVATGLPVAPGPKNTFRAENFDILYDSPFEVSNFKTIEFNVKNVPHRFVIDGEGNYDPERVRRDVQKLVENQVELMGGEIPYKDYTFFLHLRANATGTGLEHLNSSSNLYPRFGFAANASPNGRQYRDFLFLISHEFFHVWNVKRIRPDTLGPFDYSKENYTKLLWVAEGFTDYYCALTLRRANLISEAEFLGAVTGIFKSFQNTPGRFVQTAEESSFDAWIKYYRQDENSVNSQISFYNKGLILGLLLDLEIRKRSNGAKSLDDVMRRLYTDFFKKDRNYTPQDIQKLCEEMAGTSLDDFFTKYVRGKEEIDYNVSLNAAGLQLLTTTLDESGKPIAQVYFGADVATDAGKLVVEHVYAGSPAYEQGLNTGDEIIALNNMRVTEDFFNARMAEKKPGDLVTLSIFRFEDLSTLVIKLGGKFDTSYRLVSVANQTPQQQAVYRSWLGITARP